jgi:hypothetical protein
VRGPGKQKSHQHCDKRFSDHNQRGECQNRGNVVEDVIGIYQHPDRNKEQDRKRFLKGEYICSHLMTQWRFVHDHTRNKSTQGQRDPEELCSAEGDAECDRQDHQDKEFA